MEDVLRRTKYNGYPQEFFDSQHFAHDLNEEARARYERFTDIVVPWVDNVFPLEESVVLDIGSGTGSSALAFSPYVKKIHSYDIDEKAMAAADGRLSYFNVKNVVLERELFDRNAAFLKEGRRADIALFVAVLEHMKFSELEEALISAWEALRPGGVLVVAETPNRLVPCDNHTSWLPFFQQLPVEIRARYFQNSPREHFVTDLTAADPASIPDRLVRWGNGISYHEFEIVFGRQVHDWIIADGHEDILAPILPRLVDDEIMDHMFGLLREHPNVMLHVNRAFSRWFLYFIIRKPLA